MLLVSFSYHKFEDSQVLICAPRLKVPGSCSSYSVSDCDSGAVIDHAGAKMCESWQCSFETDHDTCCKAAKLSSMYCKQVRINLTWNVCSQLLIAVTAKAKATCEEFEESNCASGTLIDFASSTSCAQWACTNDEDEATCCKAISRSCSGKLTVFFWRLCSKHFTRFNRSKF